MSYNTEYDPTQIHIKRNFVRDIFGKWMNISSVFQFESEMSGFIYARLVTGERTVVAYKLETIERSQKVLDNFFESQQREIDSE